MMPKPADLYVGVVELFGIILPGAALAAALIDSSLLDQIKVMFLPENSSDISSWLAFIFISYALGHIVFLLGSYLDFIVYDNIPDRIVNKFLNGAAIKAAEKLAMNVLDVHGGSLQKSPMNAFKFSKAVLIEHCPPAAAAVDRLEADQKFFRSLTVVCALLALLSEIRPDVDSSIALVFLAIGILCLCRYVERRVKTISWACQYVVAYYASEQYLRNRNAD